MSGKKLFIIGSFLTLSISVKTLALPANVEIAKPSTYNEQIIISGTVKDEAGNPIANAKILFDTTAIATTDVNGAYSFELGEVRPSAHSIYFTAEGFVTVVRSYYPAMLSSTYDVVLRTISGKPVAAVVKPVQLVVKDTVKPVVKNIPPPVAIKPVSVQKAPAKTTTASETTTTAKLLAKDTAIVVVKADTMKAKEVFTPEVAKDPITAPATDATLDFPTILFKPNMTALSALAKAFLDRTAQVLKDNPTAIVDIKAYTRKNDPNSVLAKTRLANVVDHLVNKGVAANRLNALLIPQGGDENIIDIIATAH